MSYECISVEDRHDGGVVEITLGPPPGNIVTGQLMKEVSDALDRFQEDAGGVKLLVFSGAGKHFSFGADVEEHKADRIRDVLPEFHRLIRKLLATPVPTLAKVSGLCLGGGFEVAIACGMIFCDEKAKLGVPEIQLGVFPPVASVLLPFMAPSAAVNRLILTGEAHPAPRMHSLGLVTYVAEADKLDEAVDEFYVSQFLPKSAASLRFAFRAARAGIQGHYDAHIGAAERLYLEDLMATHDANEGITAFLEKRDADWSDA